MQFKYALLVFSKASGRSLHFHHNSSERSHVNDYNSSKPQEQVLHQLRYRITPNGEGKFQKPDAYVLPSSWGNYWDMCFLFLILDANIPKFTNVKFEKKTDVKFRNGRP